MADASKTIELIFQGVDKTAAATQAALRNLESFSGGVKQVTQPVADFTLGAAKLEAGLLTAGVAMTAFAVKTAGDFDTAFRQISTLVDASAEDLAGFREAILDYASGSTKPLEDITNALSAAIGSGVDWSQSLDLIGTAEKLAVSTRADLKSTTEVLVSTLNAYGLKTSEAGRVSDLFFQIIKDGKIEMTDLSQSLANLTPIAATAGISLEEIGAGIATLTAAGVQPSTAIDALRSAISNIIKPSEQATKLAASLGLEFNASALKSKGLAGVLDEVTKATGGSTEKMALLFGDVQGLSAVMTLTGAQAGKFKESVASMGDSAGAVAAAYKAMAGSMGDSVQQVVNAFTGLMIQIGTPLLDEFGGMAKALANIFKALGASVKDGALADLVDYVESVFGDLQISLATVAKNLPAALAQADLSGFKAGIDAVVGAFKALFGGIDLTSVNGLTRALELAGAAFLGLSKFTAGVVESFQWVFDLLVKMGSEIDGVNPDILQLAGNVSGFATQLNVLAGGLADMLPWLETLVGLLVAKQGLSLAGALASAAANAPLLAAALGPAALGAAALYAGNEVVKLVDALLQWKAASDQVGQAQQRQTDIQTKAIPTLTKFAETTGIAVKSIDEANQLVDEGKVVWDDAVNGWVKAGQAMAQVGTAAKASVNPFEAANQALLDQFAASEKAAGSAGKLADAQKAAGKYALETVPIFDAATGAITGYEQKLVLSAKGTITLGEAHGKTGTAVGKTATELDKAAEASKKWNEEVARMDHAEKLKLIEQQTTVTTARIQADAQTVKSAYESINVTITSTGDLLGKLYGQLGNMNLSGSEYYLIRNQIEAESKARAEALKLQNELTRATIDKVREQAKALQSGNALIQIDGAGLQPHLEAFMWEILKSIQTRVNADGLDMLLGTQ